jgi:hypothetical protein
MKQLALICVVGLLTSSHLFAQLAAPGAFDDFSGCSHHTCTWVPYFAQKTFQRNDFSYFVDTNGAENGATFVPKQNGKVLLRIPLKDLSASVSVVWSPASDALAVTWSNGGAIGGFDIRVFQIRDGTAIEVPASERAVADFKSRHYCRARGNNVQAYRWLNSEQLLIVTSVYPTGDCGLDAGHMDGYIVSVKDGSIIRHLNLWELRADIHSHPE